MFNLRGRSHTILSMVAAVVLVLRVAMLGSLPVRAADGADDFDEGVRQYKARRYAAAENYFLRAVEQSESNAKYHYYLGIVLTKINRDDLAVQQFTRAYWLTKDSLMRDYCQQALAAIKYKRQTSASPISYSQALAEANSNIVDQIHLEMNLGNQADSNAGETYQSALQAAGEQYAKASQLASEFNSASSYNRFDYADRATAAAIMAQAARRNQELHSLASQWQQEALNAEQTRASETAQAAANLQDRLNSNDPTSGVKLNPLGTNLFVRNYIDTQPSGDLLKPLTATAKKLPPLLRPLVATPKRLPLLDPLAALSAKEQRLTLKNREPGVKESVHATLMPGAGSAGSATTTK